VNGGQEGDGNLFRRGPKTAEAKSQGFTETSIAGKLCGQSALLEMRWQGGSEKITMREGLSRSSSRKVRQTAVANAKSEEKRFDL